MHRGGGRFSVILLRSFGIFRSPRVSFFFLGSLKYMKHEKKNETTQVIMSNIYIRYNYLCTLFKEELSYINKIMCDLINVLAILYKGIMHGEKAVHCLNSLYNRRKLTYRILIDRQFYKLSKTVNAFYKTYQIRTQLLRF